MVTCHETLINAYGTFSRFIDLPWDEIDVVGQRRVTEK
jgi:hypothetical protein